MAPRSTPRDRGGVAIAGGISERESPRGVDDIRENATSLSRNFPEYSAAIPVEREKIVKCSKEDIFITVTRITV